jgi:hypothetical protein
LTSSLVSVLMERFYQWGEGECCGMAVVSAMGLSQNAYLFVQSKEFGARASL